MSSCTLVAAILARCMPASGRCKLQPQAKVVSAGQRWLAQQQQLVLVLTVLLCCLSGHGAQGLFLC